MKQWRLPAPERGVELCVCEWQPDATGTPLVVLHGFLEQGMAWDAVATRLSRRVLAPDQRGHGLSGHVGAGGFYHFYDYVRDLDALVRHIGGPVDLLGHSMGGSVATLFAGTRPEMVRRLILVEGLGPPDTTGSAVRAARSFLDGLAKPPVHAPFADIDAGVAKILRFNPNIAHATARAMVERSTRPVTGGLVWTWDPLHRARSPKPYSWAEYRQFAAAITAPTLLIDGADSVFRFPGVTERADAFAHARLQSIGGAGHLVHHDQPERLAQAIDTFLED